jgi:hypothetical protein
MGTAGGARTAACSTTAVPASSGAAAWSVAPRRERPLWNAVGASTAGSASSGGVVCGAGRASAAGSRTVAIVVPSR